MRTIREAVPGDARAAATVMSASIGTLCAADHKGDAETIARWTANKTSEEIGRWIEGDALLILLALAGDEVAAVAGCTRDTVMLNYVAPKHRFAGHSKALLGAMEERMRAAGTVRAHLVSTLTAIRFYEAAGWRAAGPVEFAFALPGQPMEKELKATAPFRS